MIMHKPKYFQPKEQLDDDNNEIFKDYSLDMNFDL